MQPLAQKKRVSKKSEAPEKAQETKRFSPLALVPLGVALALGPLMLPRATPPTTVPLPAIDMRNVERVEASDRARGQTTTVPDDARVLGQAVRDFHVLSLSEDKGDPARVRNDIDNAVRTVLALDHGIDAIVTLRAVQLERFLAELRTFERTGQSSKELDELGGPFVRDLHDVGWEHDHVLAMDEHVRRVMFKLAWNAVTLLEKPELEPSLDEMRVLYAFYLEHPHADRKVRGTIDIHRKNAHEKKECATLDAGEGLAAESWRLDKIDKLAKIDAAYPHGYARGISLYKLGRYEDSARELEAWIEAHPDGPFALRAHAHLRAALAGKPAG